MVEHSTIERAERKATGSTNMQDGFMVNTIHQSNTRREVLDYLVSVSEDFDGKEILTFTAQDISRRLNVSRNLASQYLNDFVKEGLAVKIVSRPVYFIHKKTLEKKYRQNLTVTIFKSLAELMDVMGNQNPVRLGFKKAVGFSASLSSCVEQCKAAMRYPPNGLPILLWGATGTGKSFFVQQMYEYARGNQCIPQNSTLVTVNCGEYANNEPAFLNALFDKSKCGWLAQAAGGLLFFNQVNLLPMKLQAELFQYIDAMRPNENAESREKVPFCKLVFAANAAPRDTLDKNFLRRIPIVASLPDLEDRSVEEKSELTLTFLKDEAQEIGLEISISQQAFHAFLGAAYPENLAQLRSEIQISCAKAYLQHNDADNKLLLKLYHLPERLIEAYQPEVMEMGEDESAIHLEEALSFTMQDRSLDFFDSLLECNAAYSEQKLDFPELMKAWSKVLHEYDEFFVFGSRYKSPRNQIVGQIVERVLGNLSQHYNVQFPANCSFMITRMIGNAIQSEPFILQWERLHGKQLDACLAAVEENRPEAYALAIEASRLLSRHLNVTLSDISLLMLNIYIHNANPEIFVNDTAGVIVAHGYATASSIAQTVNALLRTQVFVPFDMPLSSSTTEIVAYVKRYIKSQRFFKNLIVLVDMGSLEEIDDGLRDVKNLNIGIVNNITTKLALDIGTGILAGNELESILKRACERMLFQYKTILRYELMDTVIFAGEVQGSTAQRMQQLFRNSLPKRIDVDIITYDFASLAKNRDNDKIFKTRNVLFISGVFNPGIREVPFVPVENIIGLLDAMEIRNIFSKYLTPEQLENFNRNLLKNFSMENVVKHITILDADRLLDFVQEAVKHLQGAMGTQFGAKTTVGLYIHISCLIERLVTKTPVDGYRNLGVFQKEHKDFIRYMRESFAQICDHYHVELPATEIGYIYDYIQGEHSEFSFEKNDF